MTNQLNDGAAAAAGTSASPPTGSERAYFDVVAAADSAAVPSPVVVGAKRPRPRDDDEVPVGWSAGAQRTPSAAKSAMVSIENLLRVAMAQQHRGLAGSPACTSSNAFPGNGTQPNDDDDYDYDDGTSTAQADAGADANANANSEAEAEAEAEARALSWADDDIDNTAMQLPPILPQIAISDPKRYAARMKQIADAERRRSKKRAKRDPNRPKKAGSAYSYFVAEFHKTTKAKAKGKAALAEAAKKIGQQWRDLNEADRKKFEDLAAKDIIRHAAEMEVYTQKQNEEEAERKEAAETAGGSNKEEAQKPKAPRTPTANRLVRGNNSDDGGVLGYIGGGWSSSSSRTPGGRRESAKLLRTASAPDIGEGWTAKTFQRQTGSTKGTTDTYWYSPALKKKFRSKAEVKRFKDALAQVFANVGEEGTLGAAHAEKLAWNAFKTKKKAAEN
jgi:high mobility group protein B1